MSKTSFSKSELINIYHCLLKNEMLPCEKISVSTDVFNSSFKNVITIIKFAKGKNQLDMALVTITYPKNQKLEEQLIKYFGGEQ